MAGARRGRETVTQPAGTLIAVDGLGERAVLAAARQALSRVGPPHRGGISRFDASGLFEQLVVAPDESTASARTLLLLYAADLAFRLRWEIEPMLAEDKTVVAAPYVGTAIAVGRAAGLRSGWLKALFQFAPASATQLVSRFASAAAGPRGIRGLLLRAAGGPAARSHRTGALDPHAGAPAEGPGPTEALRGSRVDRPACVLTRGATLSHARRPPAPESPRRKPARRPRSRRTGGRFGRPRPAARRAPPPRA